MKHDLATRATEPPPATDPNARLPVAFLVAASRVEALLPEATRSALTCVVPQRRALSLHPLGGRQDPWALGDASSVRAALGLGENDGLPLATRSVRFRYEQKVEAAPGSSWVQWMSTGVSASHHMYLPRSGSWYRACHAQGAATKSCCGSQGALTLRWHQAGYLPRRKILMRMTAVPRAPRKAAPGRTSSGMGQGEEGRDRILGAEWP